MEDIIKQAKNGDINAISKMALECHRQQRDEEAFKWLSKGAKLGDAVSMVNLAIFYANGICVNQDYEKALSLFVKAACLGANIREYLFEFISERTLYDLANKGNANAQYYYGLFCAEKQNQSINNGDEYILMALENGMPLALAAKALRSFLLNPVLDNIEAENYFIKAMDNGFDYYMLIKNIKIALCELEIQDSDALIAIILKMIKRKKNERKFSLAKIISAEYADDFIHKGRIYMQPLDNFRKSESPGVGDMFEGISNTGSNQLWNDIFQKEAVSEFMKYGMYDEYMSQERLFCLYSIEFDESGQVVKPDIRMRQFGEKVILIKDVEKFLKRFCEVLHKKHGDVWIGWGRVNYNIDFSNQGSCDEFSKIERFAWQNEFRFVEDIANGRFSKEVWNGMSELEKEKLHNKKNKTTYEKFKLHSTGMSDFAKLMALNAECSVELYEERGAEIIELGDLSDICQEFTIEDFLNLSSDFLDVVSGLEKHIWKYKPEHKKVFSLRPIMVMDN